MSECKIELQQQGLPVPRTCAKCGLDACRLGYKPQPPSKIQWHFVGPALLLASKDARDELYDLLHSSMDLNDESNRDSSAFTYRRLVAAIKLAEGTK